MPRGTLGSVAPGPVISGPVVYCLALVTVLEIGIPYIAPVVLELMGLLPQPSSS